MREGEREGGKSVKERERDLLSDLFLVWKAA